MQNPKKMTVAEFRAQGYLQEVNRLFLHPLGLALEVELVGDGKERFGEVWDYRDDPEGLTYAPGVIDAEKAERIQKESENKRNERIAVLGYHIQPQK